MSDLISRRDAIDAALTFLVEYCGAAFDEDMQKMLCERLDALPSAEPKRKKGKWIEKEVSTVSKCKVKELQSAKCSVCGKYHTTPYLYYFGNYKYCPNCGAEMK